MYIFSTLGRSLHLEGVEPWGRLASGLVELLASVLLLVPVTAWLGAMVAMAVLSGAILTHLAILGVQVQGDGGLLFGLAVAAFACSGVVLALRRRQIPAFARLLRGA